MVYVTEMDGNVHNSWPTYFILTASVVGPSKVKVTVKGAAAVDPESELEDSHHVLEANGLIWNAVLNMVDITKGTNSYYKLQVLESDGGVIKRYCVFRSWGRIGTTIGGTKVEVSWLYSKVPFSSLPPSFSNHTPHFPPSHSSLLLPLPPCLPSPSLPSSPTLHPLSPPPLSPTPSFSSPSPIYLLINI